MDTKLSKTMKKQRFNLILDFVSRGVIAALFLVIAWRFLDASNAQDDPTAKIWLFAFFILTATVGVLLSAYACFPVGRVISLNMTLRKLEKSSTQLEKGEDND